jgi:hypothetical protein
MKKLLVLFIIIAIYSSCKSHSNNNFKVSVMGNYTIYEYKVIGLENSEISDSIWKMIFKVEGIDELIINKDDSIVKVKVLTKNADGNKILDEIEHRGGEIIEFDK